MVVGNDFVPHPRADEIRRQIEYYLSDENLSKPDVYLISRLGPKGENHPIAFSVFKSFSKMHKLMKPKLKDYQMAHALRSSATLKVVNENMVKRVVPFVYDDGDESDDGPWMEKDKKTLFTPIPDHPATKLGKLKSAKDATGFEATFADAPITPQEYEEERSLYSAYTDIPSRIESALTRYVNRRKFRGEYTRMFDEFLKFGGVHKASRQGQGEGKRKYKKGSDNREGISKENIEEQDAEYEVNWEDKVNDEKWVLDFSGLAQAYLSTVFPDIFDEYTDEQVDMQCNLLTNFYNYLLHHDVVPEYKIDIILAQNVSEEARKQLKTIKGLDYLLPTPFTKACSVIFGGEWQAIYTHNSDWEDDTPGTRPRMRKEDARLIVTTAIIALGSDEMCDAATGDATASNEDYKTLRKLYFAEKRNVTMEVVSIERATADTLEFYKASGIAEKDLHFAPAPVGKLICKYWSMGIEEEYDLPPHLLPKNNVGETYTFWLEDELLASMFTGMKISAVIRYLAVMGSEGRAHNKLGEGVWVLDEVVRLWCSFYKYVINDLWTQRQKVITLFTDEQQREISKAEIEAEEKGYANGNGVVDGGEGDESSDED